MSTNNNFTLQVIGKPTLLQVDFDKIFTFEKALYETREFFVQNTIPPYTINLSNSATLSELSSIFIYSDSLPLDENVANILTYDFTFSSTNYSNTIVFHNSCLLTFTKNVGVTVNNVTLSSNSINKLKLVMKLIYSDPNS